MTEEKYRALKKAAMDLRAAMEQYSLQVTEILDDEMFSKAWHKFKEQLDKK